MPKTAAQIAAIEAEATAAESRKPVGPQPITSALYGKRRPERKPAPDKPVRKPRGTSIGELLAPHAAASLVALQAELEAAQPKRRRARRAS